MSRRKRLPLPPNERRRSCKELVGMCELSVCWQTVARWARVGVKHPWRGGWKLIRLESHVEGGRVYSSVRAVKRFISQCNGHAPDEIPRGDGDPACDYFGPEILKAARDAMADHSLKD